MKLIDQMLATRPQVDEWRGEPYVWYEQKLDGRRVTVVKEDGIVAIGRKRYIDLAPQLMADEEFLRTVAHLPERTAFDGELWVPGCPASDVMTAVNDGAGFTYSPFAAPMIGGISNKDQSPAEVHKMIIRQGFIPPVSARAPAEWQGRSCEAVHRILCHMAEQHGIEGYVLKRTSWGEWYKVKPVRTCDLIVVDWYEGSGKYTGMLGGLVGALVDGTIIADVGGGYSDAQRARFTPERTMGRVMEVKYDRVESQGRLRFPRFVRWRDDKPAEECVRV